MQSSNGKHYVRGMNIVVIDPYARECSTLIQYSSNRMNIECTAMYICTHVSGYQGILFKLGEANSQRLL